MIYSTLFNYYVISSLRIRWKIYNSLSVSWWCLWWWNGMMFILYQERCLWRYIWFTFFFIWHLHCILFIALTYGVMLWIYGFDRIGTASIIGHNDAASYLIGYEGMTFHCICIMILGMWGVCLRVLVANLIIYAVVLFDSIYLIVPLRFTCNGYFESMLNELVV